MSPRLQRLKDGYAALATYAQEHELGSRLRPLLTLAGVLVFLALVAIGLWIVFYAPHNIVQGRIDAHPGTSIPLDKQLELEDNFRKTITQIVLSVFGLILLYFTWRRSVAGDRTVRIMEQGHITDRFTKAIEQLGKFNDNGTPNIEVRLGAIYALERIAIDSVRDHWTIMEIFTAYVRENAPLEPERPYTEGEKPRTDIQAILTVLNRRRTGPKRERPDQRLDLAKTRLCGANLCGANLQGANLRNSNLQQAKMPHANMQEADLSNTNLQRADLAKANMQQAVLYVANLQRADLTEANLCNANFEEANVQEARLWKVDLQQARLWKANLQQARLWKANLQKAGLANANLQEAILTGANLQQANLWAASLQQASLEEADLRDTDNLTPEQVHLAVGWQRARYSDHIRTRLGLDPWPEDDPSS